MEKGMLTWEKGCRLVLASASPRRKTLLSLLGIPFEVDPAQGEEISKETRPAEKVLELSSHKAVEVLQRQAGNVVVLGADTVVACDGRIFGKPKDEENAKRMLRTLQGRTHQVYTGVSLLWRKDGEILEKHFYEETAVEFFPMTEDEIEGYVRTGEPMDKAGAYGIQGQGGLFVRGITGDYSNVVGLPVARTFHELESWMGQTPHSAS
jgi:septum formation protein